MPAEEWTTAEHVFRYFGRADGYPRRAEGQSVLLEQVPRDARRILDLGTGDGRLLALLRADRRAMLGVGLDFSELMLETARKRFADEEGIELIKHDLTDQLPALGRFDAVVSSMAIHHLEHEQSARSTARYSICSNRPGCSRTSSMLASPTDRLHLAFFAAIGEPPKDEDPSDRLIDVEAQLGWLRAVGFKRRRLLLEVARDGAPHRRQAGGGRLARWFRQNPRATPRCSVRVNRRPRHPPSKSASCACRRGLRRGVECARRSVLACGYGTCAVGRRPKRLSLGWRVVAGFGGGRVEEELHVCCRHQPRLDQALAELLLAIP